jgi:hypothetical protein
MRNNSSFRNLLLISCSISLLIIASCKKDNNNNNNNKQVTPTNATPTKLGFYEVDSSIYKLLLISVSKIGTQTVPISSSDLVFDTGSGGLVIDGNGILPASMITSTGFNFTGDSTVVDGITITNQTNTIEYGDDNNTTDKVFGNLAYANVTIGDANGSIVVKRLPFFIYYKATDSKNNVLPTGDFNVFGVSSEYDITFNNGAYITSPFSYFDPGTGLTKGFKMAALGTADFSYDGTYVSAITLGLTADDLGTSSGFTFTTLKFYNGEGYVPIFPATIQYGGNSISGAVLFDTGTEPYSYLQDPNATSSIALLSPSTPVSVALTGSAFNYSYTTSTTENLTYVENTKDSGTDVSVISLEFFLNNEYLIDFTDNKLGLKNN